MMQRVPPLKKTTVRLPDAILRLVNAEADVQGQSAAAFVREAIISHVIWCRTARGAEPTRVQAADLARDVLEAAAPTVELAEVRAAVDAILEYAPAELNALLRALDDTAPVRASFVRELYGLPQRGFAPEGGDATEMRASAS